MSDFYKVIILPEAQRDIRSIVLYIARELAALHLALQLQNEIEKEVRPLTQMRQNCR